MSLDKFKTALDALEYHEKPEAAQLAAMALDDAQHRDFRTWNALEEPKRREAAKVAEQAQADLIGELVDSGVIVGPDTTTVEEVTESRTAPAWVNPGTDHAKMYRMGAVVEHDGKLWQSITPGLNSWEPGTENGLTWMEVYLPEPDSEGEPAGETVPEFKQPTGAHNSYAKGAKVKFEGQVYESLMDNNAYSPAAYPAGWKQL